MGGSVADWDRLYRQTLLHMKPGGWIEVQEYEGRIVSEDDTDLEMCPFIRRWHAVVVEASLIFRRSMDITGPLKPKMIEAGFIDVHDDVYKVHNITHF